MSSDHALAEAALSQYLFPYIIPIAQQEPLPLPAFL